MPMLDWLCRRYQTLFRNHNPEAAHLVALHTTGQTDRFLREYFDHECRKGMAAVDRFSRIAADWQGGRTLDFGCGAGGVTYQLAKVSREAVGIDLEAYKLDYARAQAEPLGITNAQFVCYDGSALPFADATFDCIVSIDVLEHLPRLDHFVAEFHRVLVDGGQLLLSFGPPWFHPHGKHMWGRLPGWWTHVVFPRRVVMRVCGYPQETTWEELGLNRLSVSRFRRIMGRSGFTQLHFEEQINARVRFLNHVPWVRELFIGEVVAVYRKGQRVSASRAVDPVRPRHQS